MIKRILRHPHVKQHLSQGFKFGICGLTGFALELGTLTLLVEVFGMSKIIAKIPAMLLSVTFVFFFNKFITFKNKERSAAQTMRFVVVYTFAAMLNYICYALLVSLGVQYQLASAIVVGVIAVLNYVLSHGFIFRKQVR